MCRNFLSIKMCISSDLKISQTQGIWKQNFWNLSSWSIFSISGFKRQNFQKFEDIVEYRRHRVWGNLILESHTNSLGKTISKNVLRRKNKKESKLNLFYSRDLFTLNVWPMRTPPFPPIITCKNSYWKAIFHEWTNKLLFY